MTDKILTESQCWSGNLDSLGKRGNIVKVSLDTFTFLPPFSRQVHKPVAKITANTCSYALMLTVNPDGFLVSSFEIDFQRTLTVLLTSFLFPFSLFYFHLFVISDRATFLFEILLHCQITNLLIVSEICTYNIYCTYICIQWITIVYIITQKFRFTFRFFNK